LERRFKRGAAALTAVVFVSVLAGTSIGRYAVGAIGFRIKWATQRVLGWEPSREDIDADWRLKRQKGIEQTGRTYRRFYESEATPQWQRILKAAGLAPDDALLRWANHQWTVVLSSRVFENDDTGRVYRMRPNTRAFWTRNHTFPHGLACFFFLPDVPEVRAALDNAHEPIVQESFQTTNSLGYRGPEPNRSAAVRVLVIGDSFMQGIFVPDDQTPPENLRKQLQEAWGITVSVLNTGHIGYSPEQYYHVLLEEFERFVPHIVLLSLCPNDFGDANEVLRGEGDSADGKYYVGKILQHCRTRQVPCFVCPVPLEPLVVRRRNEGYYPGLLWEIPELTGRTYINVTEEFVAEHQRLAQQADRAGHRPAESPLFNGHLGDSHFSPLGSALWARMVARRIATVFTPRESEARSE
jgi:hypothetical protein